MPQTTTYGYDAHGNIVKKTMPNGETITQTYDALNRVTKIEGQKPSAGGLLYRYGYRYDLAGNIVFIREDYSESPASWREIQQTYDRAHRLVSEQYSYSPDGILGTDEGNRVISYRYDEADNRTQKSIFRFAEQEDYTYNKLNQLEHLGAEERSVDYEYDLNGNRILRTEDTALTGYAYDFDNRLVAVTNNTLDPAYAYNYDYRTRRVGIVAMPDSGSPATTTLSFSGGTSVQEYTDSTLNVEYIRGSDLGGGIGGILYSIRGGDASFTHYNSRGDVVAKTDNGSTLTYQAAYEAYGKRSDESGSTLDRQKANTKDEDPTGLLNEGFRYRDLEIGEFITRDPAGFVDGPNLYTYVRQNPWTKFDPRGLKAGVPEYENRDQAAVAAARDIHSYPPKKGEKESYQVEYRSDIYWDPKAKKFGYTVPYGEQKDWTPGEQKPEMSPRGTIYAGVVHNHPNHDVEPSSRKDATGGGSGDLGVADTTGQPIYTTVSDSRGEFISKYVPQPGANAENSPLREKGGKSYFNKEAQKFEARPYKSPDPKEPVVTGIEGNNYIYEVPGVRGRIIVPKNASPDAFIKEYLDKQRKQAEEQPK